jgi:MoxR-like ATPase
MSESCAVVALPAEPRERIRAVEAEIASLVPVPVEADLEALFSAILVRNATILLDGPPGSGKTTLARVIGSAVFSDGEQPPDMAVATCHQEITVRGLLYAYDLAQLMQGTEVVYSKPFMTARLKFLNEIQRAPATLHNALLAVLAERRICERGVTLHSPDFICLLDRNPVDGASRELSPAFLDRIDYGFLLPAPHLAEALAISAARRRGPSPWADLEHAVQTHLGVDTLELVWQQVEAVPIGAATELFAIMLLEAFRLCVKEERSTLNPYFDLDCSDCGFRGEVCSHLERVVGQRPLHSLLRLAQAHAWRHGRSTVDVDSLSLLLPYVLGHRVRLRPDLLRSVPTTLGWIEDVAVGQILKSKEQMWRRGVQLLLDGDEEALAQHRDSDLVMRMLSVFCDHTRVAELRERHRLETSA